MTLTAMPTVNDCSIQSNIILTLNMYVFPSAVVTADCGPGEILSSVEWKILLVVPETFDAPFVRRFVRSHTEEPSEGECENK